MELSNKFDYEQLANYESSYNARKNYLTSIWKRIYPLSYKEEFIAIVALHIPTFLTCFFQFFLQTVSVIMCGHLSKEELDAATLACSLINVSGLGIGLGISTACDTFFSQTFGSTNKKRMGIYLQRSFIVMYMALVLLYCLHLNIRPILIAIGQDPYISDMAANYLFYFLPGIFCDFTFLVLARYLQNQNVVYPPLFCALAGNVFNIVGQYIAIYQFGLRYTASAVFQAGSLFIMMITMIGYILISKVYVNTWNGWTKESLYDIGGFVKIAIPGLLLVTLETLSFEIGTFVAGIIDDIQLGAQGIVFQCGNLTYMVSVAISIAVNIRVGQQLGAGNPEGAKHSFKVAMSIAIAISLFLVTFYAVLHYEIPKWFTSDAEVQQATALILQVFSVYPFVEAVFSVLAGVLKGCGKQLIGALGNLFAYDIISLPIGIPVSLLTPIGIRGMWLALLFGVIVEIVFYIIYIYKMDWNQQSIEAQERAHGIHTNTRKVNKNTIRENAETTPLIGGNSRRNASLSSQTLVVEVEFKQSLDPFKPILIKRLVLWSILLVLLSVAATIRTFQKEMTPPCSKNCSNPLTNITDNL